MISARASIGLKDRLDKIGSCLRARDRSSLVRDIIERFINAIETRLEKAEDTR